MVRESSVSPTVFISHAGPDSDLATWVAQGLQKVGISARLDQVEIKAGDNIISWMNSAAEESDYLLVLLSPSSVNRYWVEVEWSNALMKEADLRRTFVIPCVLAGLGDNEIPFLLRSRAFIDFRDDSEAAFLKLVSRLKDDELIRRDLGSLPSPAPSNMVEEVEHVFPNNEDTIEVIIHSNRFGRSFRLFVPVEATPSYLMGMLRNTLNLKYSNVDESMGVELSYTYYLRFKGDAIMLRTSLADAGVKNGDRLELWIRVTLRDLIEDKDIGEKVFFSLYSADLTKLNKIRQARKLSFSSAEIGRIAAKFFEHVDK